MEDNENKQKSKKTQKSNSQKITIEVGRYNNLLEILKDKKKVRMLSVAIAVVGIVLFCGITFVVLSIKRLYPYNDIMTNAMGTTTVRSENKDVSYFLLNTAELWANSGIKVKKGQTITIKSSGKKHSAVHHLVKNAELNKPGLSDPWVGTEGFPDEFDTRESRDKERAKWRVFPNANQDVLLMQIVKEGEKKIDRPEMVDEKHKFIIVGNKMEDIHIDFDGTLYFAVNDVVLDDKTIIKMLWECDDKKFDVENTLNDILQKEDKLRNEFNKTIVSIKASTDNDSIKQVKISKALDNNYRQYLKNAKVNPLTFENKDPKHHKFGRCEFGFDNSKKHIELYGYYMYNYINAWYEDNVGSFLILVETKYE